MKQSHPQRVKLLKEVHFQVTEYHKTSHIPFPYTQLKKKNVVSFYKYALIASGKVKNRFDSKIGFDRVFLYFDPPDSLRLCF